MRKKYTTITKDELSPIVASSLSYAECLRKLGLVTAGGNYKQLQKRIDRFDLDTNHMTHQVWNRGMEVKTFDNLTTPASIKKRLVKERGHKCESCNLIYWLNKYITLELEHIDGNSRNNDRTNLLLICPNCHSQTPTWRNRKR